MVHPRASRLFRRMRSNPARPASPPILRYGAIFYAIATYSPPIAAWVTDRISNNIRACPEAGIAHSLSFRRIVGFPETPFGRDTHFGVTANLPGTRLPAPPSFVR